MNLVTFNENVRAHRDRIYGFAVHYLKDVDEAADVTQDVFIKLWQHRDSVDTDRLLGWLLRVTRNACIDAYRKRKTRHDVFDQNADVDLSPSDHRSPEKEARAALFREHLEQALAEIDEPYRSIVVLREIQEFKYEEIAEAMDMPLNTVKVYLHRARKALRDELGEHVRYDYAG